MLGSLPPSSPSRLSSVTPGYFKNVLFGLPMVAALTKVCYIAICLGVQTGDLL